MSFKENIHVQNDPPPQPPNFGSIEEFSKLRSQVLPTIIPKAEKYFKDTYPEYTDDEIVFAAELLARVNFMLNYLLQQYNSFPAKLKLAKDMNVSMITQPIFTDGTEMIDDIRNLSDEEILALEYEIAHIFLRVKWIASLGQRQGTLNETQLNDLYQEIDETTIEEVAHAAYYYWMCSDKSRLQEHIPMIRSIIETSDPTAPKFMDEADYDNYKNNQIEQHAKIWIEAYRQTK